MKILGPTTDFPTWGSSKGTENPQGLWLWRSTGFDYWISTGLGKQRHLEGPTKTCVHQDPGERTVTPQETESDSPMSVWELLVEAWVNCSLPQGQGHWQQQSWEAWHAGVSPFGGGCHYPFHRLASGQTMGREHSPTHQQKIGLKIYWAWPCQSKTQFSPQPVLPIRKLP